MKNCNICKPWYYAGTRLAEIDTAPSVHKQQKRRTWLRNNTQVLSLTMDPQSHETRRPYGCLHQIRKESINASPPLPSLVMISKSARVSDLDQARMDGESLGAHLRWGCGGFWRSTCLSARGSASAASVADQLRGPGRWARVGPRGVDQGARRRRTTEAGPGRRRLKGARPPPVEGISTGTARWAHLWAEHAGAAPPACCRDGLHEFAGAAARPTAREPAARPREVLGAAAIAARWPWLSSDERESANSKWMGREKGWRASWLVWTS
jgi:hypothetical protein